MTKSLENKTKKISWKEWKDIAKIVVLANSLILPVVTNVGGYLSTKHIVSVLQTEMQKKDFARITKDCYRDAGVVQKILTYGDYVAANEYIQNKK